MEPASHPPTLQHARITLVPAVRRVLVDGEPARVGSRAFDLLHVLGSTPGQIVGKQELLERVWPGTVVEENNLQVQVCALRKLLGAQSIVTVPGRGYALAVGVEVSEAPEAAPQWNPRTPRGAAPAAGSLTPLRGRDAEQAVLARLVAEHRLVTVTGPGGVGKSRLAQVVAAGLARQFADGVHTVELAQIGTRGSVAGCIARAVPLGGAERGPQALAAALEDRALLLVIENAEHVAQAACETIDMLLQRSGRSHVLVTSQVPLNLHGEHVLRLAPLPLPSGDVGEGARDAASLQLLLDAIDAVAPGRVLDPQELRDAFTICRQLDGMPLALELAAARVPMFGVAGVRRMLPERLHMLTSGARGTSARQRSLLGCLEWSWQLLEADERKALQALASHIGVFSLRAARRALARSGLTDWRGMELLGSLVAKSVVLADRGDQPHFRIPESMRIFTLQQAAPAQPLPGVHIVPAPRKRSR